jgi:hypothetical protein
MMTDTTLLALDADACPRSVADPSYLVAGVVNRSAGIDRRFESTVAA